MIAAGDKDVNGETVTDTLSTSVDDAPTRVDTSEAGDNTTQTTRLFGLATMMVAVIATAAGISLTLLYNSEMDRQSELLRELALGEARLIKTVISSQTDGVDGKILSNTALAEITAKIARELPKAQFGESGEFILARRQGDQIILTRRGAPFSPGPTLAIPMQSDLAAPARFGLLGKSGIVTVLDYAGTTVLAAHEPVPEYKLAVVAKINLQEVRGPFFLAAIWLSGGLVVFLVLVIGGWHRISLSIAQRERTAARLRQSEERLVRAQQIAKLGGWQYDFEAKEFSVTDEVSEILGLSNGDVDKVFKAGFDYIHPDDIKAVKNTRFSALKSNQKYDVEYRIIRPDGIECYIFEQGAFAL